jgi:hypothetical protein
MEHCWICLESDPRPERTGCGCRGDAAHAHAGCLVKLAASKGDIGLWSKCITCKQAYTGPVRLALAEAWLERARRRETLPALQELALALDAVGNAAEAEVSLRRLHAVMTRLAGATDPRALLIASQIGAMASNRGRFAEAEGTLRLALAGLVEKLGPDAKSTMGCANSLAVCLMRQHKDSEAEVVLRDLVARQRRVLGRDDELTLASEQNLAVVISDAPGRRREAEAMLEETLARLTRVFGAGHANTRVAADSLAHCRDEAVGTRVLVQDLTQRPQHNGKAGRVASYDAATGRYAVEIDGATVLMRPANTRPACARDGCVKPDTLTCSGCGRVGYCSKECQRAHWKAHKPACRAAK